MVAFFWLPYPTPKKARVPSTEGTPFFGTMEWNFRGGHGLNWAILGDPGRGFGTGEERRGPGS